MLSDRATVVPAPESNGVSPEADLEALRRADLFVQLFHGLDRLDNAKAQLKGAEAEAKFRTGKAGKPFAILRWRKKLFDPKADSALLESLAEENQKFFEGSRTGTLEEFKLAISDKLQELSNPPPPPSPAGQQPYLYITADKSDRDLADYNTYASAFVFAGDP